MLVLAAGVLALQVLPSGADTAGLGDGDHVQGVVGLPVAAAVESDLPCAGAGPHRDRGGAGEPGVGVLVPETVDPGGLADQHGRREHSAAGDGKQRGGLRGHQGGSSLLEGVDQRVELDDRASRSAGQSRDDPVEVCPARP